MNHAYAGGKVEMAKNSKTNKAVSEMNETSRNSAKNAEESKNSAKNCGYRDCDSKNSRSAYENESAR